MLHAFLLASAIHLAILDGAKAVDSLVFVERKSLTDLLNVAALLTQQDFSLCCKKRQVALRILFHRQFTALPLALAHRQGNILRLSRNYKALRGLTLHDVNNRRGNELNLYILRVCLQGDSHQGQ